MHRRRGGPRPAALRSRAPFAALVGLATASALLVGACRSPGTADIGLPAPAGTHSPNGATGGNGSSPRASHEVIELVDDRGRRIDSFDAQLDLSLRRADGAAADLAGALRMARPDRFRLRSTKFGFLVCEVVMREGSAWAIMSPVVKDQARASAEATHDLLRVLGSLLGWRASGTGELAIVA
ncbi:MAG: hypothetical protein FJ253_05795, partial [Phycisphaerae bacterium]|nr:hypothetical protein [Phycisphaerae bacterium]